MGLKLVDDPGPIPPRMHHELYIKLEVLCFSSEFMSNCSLQRVVVKRPGTKLEKAVPAPHAWRTVPARKADAPAAE